MKKTFAKIQIPMFEIDSKIRLKDAMKQLGIKDVFEQTADLSPMIGKHLAAKVSDISHAVKLTMDGNGVGEPKIPSHLSSLQKNKTTDKSIPKRLVVRNPFYFVISNRCWAPGSAQGCSSGNIPLYI